MVTRVSQSNAAFFQALGSATRLRIVELLSLRPTNITDLARALGISPAITTRHVQQLERAGIVRSQSVAGGRGTQKLCSLAMRHLSLAFGVEAPAHEGYTCSIPVGQYAAYAVRPTCGLASPSGIIGAVDDPRYFADPQHVHASLVWWGSGWLEYRIPNYLLARQRAVELRVSLEICSEAPGWNERWPSDIGFSVNGTDLGTWTSPGDFGAERGLLNPAWWPAHNTQHGLLKTVSVTRAGSFVDGIRMSAVAIEALGIRYGGGILFRVSCPEGAAHRGGVSLFGRNFGNYGMDIEAAMDCAAEG